MLNPCSLELRERVVEAIESGASRRKAAEWFAVSPTWAIKWMQRRQETGSIAPKPSGGSISPLEAHADFLLVLIAERSKSRRAWPAHGGAGEQGMFDQPDWFIDKSDSLPMHKVAGVRELIASTKAIERTIPRNSRRIRALMAKFSSQKCVNYLR